MIHTVTTPIVLPGILSFLAGAALGAVGMALFTPRTGPMLRRTLRDLAWRTGETFGGLDRAIASALEDWATEGTGEPSREALPGPRNLSR